MSGKKTNLKLVRQIIATAFSASLLFVNILILQLFPTSILAQEVDTILVLHSTLEQGDWHRRFNATFSDAVQNTYSSEVEVVFQSLRLDRPHTTAVRTRLRQHIEEIIKENGIDLIVSVFPSATDFVLELEGTAELPHVLVMPGLESIPNVESSSIVSIGRIPSTWRQSIQTTLEQILILRPQTQTIEVFVGNNTLDEIYLDRMQQVALGFSGRVEFKYHVGVEPVSLQNYAAQLGDSSSVLLLPATISNGDRTFLAWNFLPELAAASAVPIFGIVDTLVGRGMVGGNVSSVETYAITAIEMAIDFLREGTEPDPVVLSETSSVFDWRQVERWNLPLQLLDTPYTLLFKSNTLWEEYPIISIATLNLILLLFVGMLIQYILLKRSRAAQLIVAASEDKFRTSEAKYRLLADNSIDVIWTWEIDSASLNYCSPAIESLTGFTPEEYVRIRLTKLMVPESVALYQSLLASNDTGPHVVEIELYKKAGGTVWCEIAAQRTAPQVGMPMEWVGVTRDISQRRASEVERQALESQVRQAQKMESLGTLAGGIAHDFNNILAVVTGITELLKVELSNHESASQLLNKLMGASDKATALVSQILTFSRQSKGQKAVTNLSVLVEDSLDILAAGIPKQIALKTQIDGGALNVMADPSHMGQVIINLITNASEAIDTPGGCISVTLSRCHFDEVEELPYGRLSPGNYACLRVEDNGTGMSEQQVEKIFEPFFTSKELGNGLGLAIVHGIVMDHQGGIDIHSVLGEGTSISIYLPLTELRMPVVPELEAETAEVEGKLNAKRILVVDDNTDLLEMVSSMLRHLGHDCVLCSDSSQAFELLEREHEDLDLVITDYSMPKISGIEILDHCAEHYPSLPVILSTGYSNKVGDLLERGGSTTRILSKPYDFRALKEALQQSV